MDEIAGENSTDTTAEAPDTASPPLPASASPPRSATAERVAILTPGGPLILDIHLTIDGEPHSQALDALVQRVLEAADSDGDGRPTWNELAANEAYFASERPDGRPPDSRQLKMLIERYDANRDGVVQRDEAAAWLGRDAGSAARPLAVRSSRAYFPVPRATSQLWQLLDTDRNGRLSAEEIRRAPETLLSFDAEDLRVITPLELASLREQLEAAAGRAAYVSRETTRYAAIHLEPDFDAERLLYLLGDLYAAGRELTPRSFPALGRLFHELDANGDGWLELDELASMLTIEPHVELSVAFDRSAGSEEQGAGGENSGSPLPAPCSVLLLGHAPEVAVVAQAAADRLVLSLGTTRLVISAHDLAVVRGADQTLQQAAAASQICMMVHDQFDALFEALDENADGKLGEREIAVAAQRLLELDANGDGQLTSDELPYCLIVALVRGESPSEQSFYVPASMTRPASTAELPAWFARADLNGDGEVSRREFLGTDEQFALLDADGDGYITATEAVEQKSSRAEVQKSSRAGSGELGE